MINRHVDMIKFAETWITDIAPMARTLLEDNKEHSSKCKVQWNGENGFEISDGGYSFVVHLDKKYCDCRLWMLRGIPCPHAICAYYYLNQDPDQYVEHWYRKETFLKAYSHFIQPIPNMRMWPKTTNPSIEPPKPRKMPGRPKKNRRKRKYEPKKFGKISKKGVKMTCSICKRYGHNKSVCATRGSTSQASSVCGDTTAPPKDTQTGSKMGGPSSQASSVCGDTTAPPKDTQTGQHQVYENYNSFCSDTRSVQRGPQKKGHGGLGRGLGRKAANARGTPFVSETHDSSSQVPPKSSHKRTYNSALFVAATGTNKRPTTGFAWYIK